ncbi:hypothetical protein OG413_42440 [Streptomyces sp. NBC_01433]|uniref:hypothetical protein n=1 Tax=Streptomyces sp. NBC_01433 TaxID=2903864 RepID=UPI00224E460F|nr:hypothetical protein [Streptomyces sp. NBC_01433]MCX4681866.1 hypothetical protein [Streptomyces sp. NBC_01433]
MLIAELGRTEGIARKRVPAPVRAAERWVVERWVVERTHSWMNDYGRLRQATALHREERRGSDLLLLLLRLRCHVFADLVQDALPECRRGGPHLWTPSFPDSSTGASGSGAGSGSTFSMSGRDVSSGCKSSTAQKSVRAIALCALPGGPSGFECLLPCDAGMGRLTFGLAFRDIERLYGSNHGRRRSSEPKRPCSRRAPATRLGHKALQRLAAELAGLATITPAVARGHLGRTE